MVYYPWYIMEQPCTKGRKNIMETSEAINFLIEKKNEDTILSEKYTETIQSAINCIRNDKMTSVNILLEILSCIEGKQETLQDNSTCKSINLAMILFLLADLGAKEAFPYIVCALSSEDENNIFDHLYLCPDCLGTVLANIISNEDDVVTLKKCVFMQDIHTSNRFSAYFAVSLYRLNSNNKQDLEAFYEKLLYCFSTGQLEPKENHGVLVSMHNICIQHELNGLFSQIQDLLLQLLETYPYKYHSNSFVRDYFHILFKLDPPVKERIKETLSYLRDLTHCIDNELFQCNTLADVGKFLFEKTLADLPNTNQDIIKLAIRQLQCYPFNNRTVPCTDTQYWEELCYCLEITQPPKELYLRAQKLYNDIFLTGYQNTYNRIEELIQQTKEKRKEVKITFETIIGKANGNYSIKKDICSFEDAFTANYFKEKELHALYDDKNDIEYGLLSFYRESLENLFKQFCGEIGASEKANERLRRIVLDCIRYNNENDTVDDRFRPYETILKKFNYLVADKPELTLKKLFYKVKFLPFATQIENSIKIAAFQTRSIHNEDERETILARMQHEEEKHPLYPESLMQCADKNLIEYQSKLEDAAPDATAQIRRALSSSSCLSERRALIDRSLQLLETHDDEVVMYLLPVQIEGLFGDLFKYSSVYACTLDMGRYRNIIHSELVETIQHSISGEVNLTLDAVAYFKYYFSSIIRNTIAHGKHKLLVERWQIDRKGCENKYSDTVYKRIIVLELLLDLNFLIEIIVNISEVDAAIEYVNTTASCLADQHDDGNGNNLYFSCLLDDLMGKRKSLHKNHYKSGIFTSYDPLQILCWCFNPYFEKYFDDGGANLNTVRKTICSSDFWNYVIDKLDSYPLQEEYRRHLRKIIQKMFHLRLPPEICTLLQKANRLCNKSFS